MVDQSLSVHDQIKNIMAFLSILFGESKIWHDEIMKFPPDYIIEKYLRYVLSTRPESEWGLHPLLRNNVFNPYCEKWNIPTKEYYEV